ncbi:MAG: hypothetical protein JF615_17390, partial [Asticcacaulis sp.]|nr:hypothetical protein [Asticcacaulis sp.]
NLGDDTFYVDNTADRVFESSGQGTDTVFSSVNFNIGNQNIETVILTGIADINATGGNLANSLTGNAGSNTLTGNGGNDVLDGGAGADIMAGNQGDDTFYVDNAGDQAVEANGQGADTVFSSVSFSLGGQYVETLSLTGAADIDATGNGLANTLNGNAGNNTLDGGLGADTMSGGDGDDTYYVDSINDQTVEAYGAGNDTVVTTVSIAMGDNIETGILVGSSDITLLGNAAENTLIGNAGNNALDGAGGPDIMRGGAGDDSYYIHDLDTVQEDFGGGHDQIIVIGSFSLMDALNVEDLWVLGFNGSVATGNDLDNTIRATGADDTIIGHGGNDRL